MIPDDVRSSAAEVRLLALDVDGVLTDGTLYYGPEGELLKAFHVRDGLGLRLLGLAGIDVAVISAKRSAPLARRLADLAIAHVHLGREDKRAAMQEVCDAVGVAPREVAYVGDDLIDLPLLAEVGLPITVADGHPLVRQRARWITTLPGGRGAVREVCDGLLEARGRLDAVVEALSLSLQKGRT